MKNANHPNACPKCSEVNDCVCSKPKYDTRHGGPYDRGSADAYYHRPASPHYFTGATYSSEKVTDLTAEEVEAYMAGYNECTDRKEW